MSWQLSNEIQSAVTTKDVHWKPSWVVFEGHIGHEVEFLNAVQLFALQPLTFGFSFKHFGINCSHKVWCTTL